MFLPVSKQEFEGQLDFVLISADAYVDHPSFGHAIIGRYIQSLGFSVGIIAQPLKDSDYKRLGEPKHGFLISGGVVDSMVNNYTVAKRKRDKDEYSEGGKVGMRPDRATTVYSKKLKQLFPDVPVVIGGIEASLRRFAHYDYWSNTVMPSILLDSGADLLVYGMGEKPFKDILSLVSKGVNLKNIKDVRGTAYLSTFDSLSKRLKADIESGEAIYCPSFEEVKGDKVKYVEAFNIQSKNVDPYNSKILLQKHKDVLLVQNKPQYPLSVEEMDAVYSLPYERTYHPMYKEGVPAITEVKYSLTSVRGCFGSCSYCALTYHQGRIVQKRSEQNIIDEAVEFTKDKDFKGYIHDVGGPTANFRDPACEKQCKHGACKEKLCIGFNPCKNLKVDHKEYLHLLRALREIKGIKKVFIRSGIRFDYLMMDKNDEFLREIIKHHISGQLKVAPEHTEDSVLKLMNKPSFSVYKNFKEKYDKLNEHYDKKQYLVPYLISSHPGCTLKAAIKVAEYLASIGYMPEQVQDFYPTPSTKSTCMYYTEIDPDTMQKVYVPKTAEEKRLQRALLQYRKKENYHLIKEALIKAGRQDLIGFKPGCLIKPMRGENFAQTSSQNKTKMVGKGNFKPKNTAPRKNKPKR